MSIKHALSIDVEDWFQGFLYRGISGLDKYGSREEPIIIRILELLDKYDVKATFFVLGKYAEAHPSVIKMIDNYGHEIASHGYLHKPVPYFTLESFRKDVKLSKMVIEDIISKKIIGHRAASWSITSEYLWALDILAEEGFEYDSSIFPTKFHKYGIKDFPLSPQMIKLNDKKSIFEFPAQVYSLLNLKFPSAGGFYLRAFPFPITKWSIVQSEKRKTNAMIYFHPYDMDTEVPKIKTGFIFKLIRYYHLEKTEIYIKRLLENFEFCPIVEILQNLK